MSLLNSIGGTTGRIHKKVPDVNECESITGEGEKSNNDSLEDSEDTA